MKTKTSVFRVFKSQARFAGSVARLLTLADGPDGFREECIPEAWRSALAVYCEERWLVRY